MAPDKKQPKTPRLSKNSKTTSNSVDESLVPPSDNLFEDLGYASSSHPATIKSEQLGGASGAIVKASPSNKTNVNSSHPTISRGRSLTHGEDVRSKSHDNSKQVGNTSKRGAKSIQRLYDDEAEEAEEEDDDDNDYENDEDDDNDNENGVYDDLYHSSSKQGNALDCDDKCHGAINYGGYEKKIDVNDGVHHEDPAFAISVDHNIHPYSAVRPVIGSVGSTNQYYNSLAQNKNSHQAASPYAASFNPPKGQQSSTTSSASGTSTFAPSQMARQSSSSGINEHSMYKSSTLISASTGYPTTTSLNGESGSTTSQSPFGGGNTVAQNRSMNYHTSPIQMIHPSPKPMNQQSHMHTSSPSSINSFEQNKHSEI